MKYPADLSLERREKETYKECKKTGRTCTGNSPLLSASMGVSKLEIRKIFKTGNSLVLSLPVAFLKELELSEGDNVIIEVLQDKFYE